MNFLRHHLCKLTTVLGCRRGPLDPVERRSTGVLATNPAMYHTFLEDPYAFLGLENLEIVEGDIAPTAYPVYGVSDNLTSLNHTHNQDDTFCYEPFRGLPSLRFLHDCY